MIDKNGNIVRSVMKDIHLDEISAVDSPAQVGARATIMKRSQDFTKGAVLTSDSEGHSHLIIMRDSTSELFAGETQYVDNHSHMWVRTEAGQVILGMANGHTHQVDVSTMTKATAGAPDSAEASKSNSGSNSADRIGNVPIEVQMTQKNEETVDQAVVEQLTKRAERAEQVAELTDAQRGIFKSLDAEGQDAFLALSPELRDGEVAKAAEANAVVYKSSTGEEFRKSDDPRLVAMAKRADEERALRIAGEQKAVQADLAKRAGELQHIPGDISVRMSILKGIDSLPEVERTAAMQALKAQDVQLAEAFKRAGTSATPQTEDPLQAIAKRLRAADPSLNEHQAMAKALQTPEGELAYAQSLGR